MKSDDTLTQLFPPTPHAARPERFVAELRRALADHADSLSTSPMTRPIPVRPRRVALRRPMASAAVVAALLAAVLVLTGGGGPGGAPAPASAASLLRAAARALNAQRAVALGPGRYWYTDVVVATRHGRRLRSVRYEAWMARNGAGRQHQTGDEPTTVAASRAPFPFGLGRLSYAQLASLPTQPSQLEAVLRRLAARQRRIAPDGDLLTGPQGRTYLMFALIRSAFEDPAPPQLRAALYELFARTPGLHRDGQLTDASGRTGAGVSAVFGDVRFVMIIDPRTGQLLENQRILLRRSDQLGPGTPVGLYSRATFVHAGVVSSVGERPGATH